MSAICLFDSKWDDILDKWRKENLQKTLNLPNSKLILFTDHIYSKSWKLLIEAENPDKVSDEELENHLGKLYVNVMILLIILTRKKEQTKKYDPNLISFLGFIDRVCDLMEHSSNRKKEILQLAKKL